LFWFQVSGFWFLPEGSMRRWSSLILLLLVVISCGTGKSARPANVPQPGLRADLTHDIFFGSGATAPATIDVTVLNRAAIPIMLRRVEITSPGMTQFGLYSTYRDLRETLGPGQEKSFPIFATAWTNVRNPTEPLTIRAVIDFEAEGKVWREMVITH
jgi:hypothetical protein